MPLRPLCFSLFLLAGSSSSNGSKLGSNNGGNSSSGEMVRALEMRILRLGERKVEGMA